MAIHLRLRTQTAKLCLITATMRSEISLSQTKTIQTRSVIAVSISMKKQALCISVTAIMTRQSEGL